MSVSWICHDDDRLMIYASLERRPSSAAVANNITIFRLKWDLPRKYFNGKLDWTESN